MRKQVILYGILGGILIVGLKLIEYRWLVVEHSIEIYGGSIAAIFAGVGIWLGLRLTRQKERVVVREVAVRHPRNSSGTNASSSRSRSHPANWRSSP